MNKRTNYRASKSALDHFLNRHRDTLHKQENARRNALKKGKWAIIYEDTGKVHSMHDERSQAEYCVTDVFGPEWNTVYISLLNCDN